MTSNRRFCRGEGAYFPEEEFIEENGIWIHNTPRPHLADTGLPIGYGSGYQPLPGLPPIRPPSPGALPGDHVDPADRA
jgi:hypothetical protein